ncbi:MAG: isoleucine--tRNA ligase [Leptospiraceae bacterium]|nr:isoleucine--tRNA ligase [Leptospiraceae bacterium]
MVQFNEISKQERDVSERQILEFWQKIDVFGQGERQNADGETFVFFEGPPTTNGLPGIHHVLARVYKDIYIRYQMMQGRHVPRRAGWDCHGLPVEREVEKALGIESKAEIEQKIGVAEFNRLCRESVQKYIGEWDRFSERMGFQVDLGNAYFTMDNHFIESVWALLKLIWDKGLIYQGFKVVPCDPVLGATMSDAEVDQGYRDTEDPSVTVAFQLKPTKLFEGDVRVLVWTTTPWTLPSNVALAVHPDVEYILVEILDGHDQVQPGQYLCAADLLESVLTISGQKQKKGQAPQLYEYQVLQRLRGSELAGLEYEQLIDYIPQTDFARHRETNQDKRSCVIVTADFVTTDTGTGIVHIAPAYGADDLEVGIAHDLAVVHAVGLDGNFISGTPHAGIFFKEADKIIIKELKAAGSLWRNERYKHSYPFGYRTGAPLLYYAKNAWYIRTTAIRDQLIKNNNDIRWVPEHIRDGRFGNWLASNRDWALSRERYWGTPLPVWTDGDGNFRIIGSVAELEELCGQSIGDMDLHRPYVDDITFTDPKTGRQMRRVPEVIDCWFDSGAMPYAQWGWPVRGKEQFDQYFPADFISEAIDQTRGWFYTLLCVSTMVSETSSYKNVVCLGHVLDEKGEKMSKSKGNIVKPDDVFARHGADGIRWYFLTQSPAGNSRRVGQPGSANDPVAIVHGFFNMLVNSVNFFVLYANVDGIALEFEQGAGLPSVAGALPFDERTEMDRWILSALQQLIESVTRHLDEYDSQAAGQEIEEFCESLSNWYIRRNRRRFWKGDLDSDKKAAYDTLYRCLLVLSRLIAPFAPFLAEQLWQSLLPIEVREACADSIHLSRWPARDSEQPFDAQSLQNGQTIKTVAYLGRAARKDSGLKVRQPLAELMIYVDQQEQRRAIERFANELKDELNVKAIRFLDESAGILDYRIKPNLPVLGKRLGPAVRHVQTYLASAHARELVQQFKAGQAVIFQTESGEQIELGTDEVLIESISKEGTAGAEAQGMLVALDTRLTPGLIAEGQARDLVRHIQELRKNSGLNVTDRILIQLDYDSPALQSAFQDYADFICSETLAKFGSLTDDPVGRLRVDLDGSPLMIQIARL